MYGMFNNDYNLTSVEEIGNWDTGNVEIMSFLFWNCYSLPEVDVANWNTSKVTAFNSMFAGGGHNDGEMLFTHLSVENRDVSKVVTMSEFFNANGKDMHVEYLDLSAFNTLSLKDVESMFNGCYRLTTVYVGDGWELSKVTDSANMFAGCDSLVGGQETAFKPGYTNTWRTAEKPPPAI